MHAPFAAARLRIFWYGDRRRRRGTSCLVVLLTRSGSVVGAALASARDLGVFGGCSSGPTCDPTQCLQKNQCVKGWNTYDDAVTAAPAAASEECRLVCTKQTDCPFDYHCVTGGTIEGGTVDYCVKDRVPGFLGADYKPAGAGEAAGGAPWGAPCDPSKGFDSNADCDGNQSFWCYGTSPTDANSYCTQFQCTDDGDCPGGWWCEHDQRHAERDVDRAATQTVWGTDGQRVHAARVQHQTGNVLRAVQVRRRLPDEPRRRATLRERPMARAQRRRCARWSATRTTTAPTIKRARTPDSRAVFVCRARRRAKATVRSAHRAARTVIAEPAVATAFKRIIRRSTSAPRRRRRARTTRTRATPIRVPRFRTPRSRRSRRPSESVVRTAAKPGSRSINATQRTCSGSVATRTTARVQAELATRTTTAARTAATPRSKRATDQLSLTSSLFSPT